MSVSCRREDKARFEELGFQLEFDKDENNPVIELVDDAADYAHHNALPTDIPFLASNGAGCNYGEAKIVCDGKKTVEVSTDHDGDFSIAWDDRRNQPSPESINCIRRFLRVEKRVLKLFKVLNKQSLRKHLFSPDTHLCVKCGVSTEDDAVENQPCIK